MSPSRPRRPYFGVRVERDVSVIRLYENGAHYEEMRNWLRKYGELMPAYDRATDSGGCFLIVEHAVVDEFFARWPEAKVA